MKRVLDFAQFVGLGGATWCFVDAVADFNRSLAHAVCFLFLFFVVVGLKKKVGQ